MLPSILGRYFIRRYFTAFFAIATMLMSVVYFLEITELFRRAADKPSVTTGMVMLLGAVKLPQTFQVILPFITLFAAIFTLWRLSRSQEMTIARASGRSIWQIIMPLFVTILLFGVIDVTVFNPISSKLFGTYRRLEARYLSNTSVLEVSTNGLWMRQAYGENDTAVIHSDKIGNSPINNSLQLQDDVLVLILGPDEQYKARIDAESGELQGNKWVLHNAVERPLNGTATPPATIEIPTTLTQDRIEDTLLSPETLSFWELPDFIAALKATGFSSKRHQQHYDQLLWEPIWLLAMMLIAVVFMQRQLRQGQALLLLTGALLTGVAAFILNNTVLAFGVVGALPTIVAAAAVPFAMIAVGVGTLLHLEEGA